MNHELIKDLESGKKGKSSGLKQQHLVSLMVSVGWNLSRTQLVILAQGLSCG